MTKTLHIDLRQFLVNYADAVPDVTTFECILLGPVENGVMRLNWKPPYELTFQDKAYDLFRVVEKEDGTIDIMVAPVDSELAMKLNAVFFSSL